MYEYKRNVACLEVLRGDLQVLKSSTDVKAQSYEVMFGNNMLPSDPVVTHFTKIETVENRIKQLERWTSPIRKLEEDLNAPYVLENSRSKELLEILRLYYFGGNAIDLVTSELKISRSPFFRRRRELVLMAINYLGF